VRKIIASKRADEIASINNLFQQIDENRKKIHVGGLAGASRSFLISLVFQRLNRTVLIVCPEEKEAAAFARDLSLFLGEESVFHYPSLDFLTIDMFALQREEELLRLETLANLQISHKLIIVTSANA